MDCAENIIPQRKSPVINYLYLNQIYEADLHLATSSVSLYVCNTNKPISYPPHIQLTVSNHPYIFRTPSCFSFASTIEVPTLAMPLQLLARNDRELDTLSLFAPASQFLGCMFDKTTTSWNHFRRSLTCSHTRVG